MRKPQLDPPSALEVKMTPMIDVVFLLLIFFVWTSSFESPEFDLPGAIAQPPAGGSELNSTEPPVEAFDEIVIRVTDRDTGFQILLNRQPIEELATMKRRLSDILALGVQPPVIIDPDDAITMGVAVEVYDAARAAGADRVLFAVTP